MKRLILAAAALAALCAPALAYTDPVSGAPSNAIIVDPSTGQTFVPQQTAVISAQYGLAITSSTALTVPATATSAIVCASTAAVRYTIDGTTTPTASVGMPLASAACITIPGYAALSAFKALSATGTLDVTYWK